MPTKNPRINVVLTPRIYADVQTLSEARGLSMSSVVGDLIEDAPGDSGGHSFGCACG